MALALWVPACDKRSAREGRSRSVRSASNSAWSQAAVAARCQPRSRSPAGVSGQDEGAAPARRAAYVGVA